MPFWNANQVDISLMIKKRKGRNEKSKKTKTIIQDVKEFSSVTTVHGITYLASSDHSICARLFWILTVVLAAIGTSYQVVSIWNLWGSSPVITTLETISYPIDKIEFPAVTLCPQGSVFEVIEAALYYQFEEWLLQRTERDQTRKKRATDKITQISSNLTSTQLSQLLVDFLNEVYPGAKDLPTKYASVLNADDPEQMIETSAILIPEKETRCDETENLDVLDQLNKKITKECPEPFKKLGSSTCIVLVDNELTYDDASSFCQAQDGAKLHTISSWEDIEALENLNILGTCLLPRNIIQNQKTYTLRNSILISFY